MRQNNILWRSNPFIHFNKKNSFYDNCILPCIWSLVEIKYFRLWWKENFTTGLPAALNEWKLGVSKSGESNIAYAPSLLYLLLALAKLRNWYIVDLCKNKNILLKNYWWIIYPKSCLMIELNDYMIYVADAT